MHKTLLEDTFDFQGIEFRVSVEDERECFIHKETGEVRAVSMANGPRGVHSLEEKAKYVSVETRVAVVKPKDAFTRRSDWPDHASTRKHVYDPAERVVAAGPSWFPDMFQWTTTVEREQTFSPQDLATRAINNLKEDYHTDDSPQGLDENRKP